MRPRDTSPSAASHRRASLIVALAPLHAPPPAPLPLARNVLALVHLPGRPPIHPHRAVEHGADPRRPAGEEKGGGWTPLLPEMENTIMKTSPCWVGSELRRGRGCKCKPSSWTSLSHRTHLFVAPTSDTSTPRSLIKQPWDFPPSKICENTPIQSSSTLFRISTPRAGARVSSCHAPAQLSPSGAFIHDPPVPHSKENPDDTPTSHAWDTGGVNRL